MQSLLDLAPSDPGQKARQAANRRLHRALFKLHSRVVRTRTRRTSELGLTSARLRILEQLLECPGISITGIAFRLDLCRQAVHRVVHDLARAGYLTLERGRADDRRAVIPNITARGWACTYVALEWQRDFSGALTLMFGPRDLQFTAMAVDRLWRHLSSAQEAGRGYEVPSVAPRLPLSALR
jgi:DNA-binding MarR family transcriptional regulator